MKTVALLLLLFFCAPGTYATRLYVKANATGANNGTSWTDAFTKLEYALSYPNYVIDTVWVANGTYITPAGNGWVTRGTTKLFGGFTGTETALSQRSWNTYQTVLDANINNPNLRNDNNYVIVEMFFDTSVSNCVVDGFKLTNAYAPRNSYGSAIIIRNRKDLLDSTVYFSNITINNCLFVNNVAPQGGAISMYDCGKGQVSINNCRFEQDSAWVEGGAIASNGRWYGGPISRGLPARYQVIVNDCSFRACYAAKGGAISASDSTFIINRCSFVGNSTSGYGGALYDSANVLLKAYSSLFAGNSAQLGAAHYAPDPALTTAPYKPHAFYNCTFSGNSGTIIGNNLYTLFLRGADTLRNSIFWANSPGFGVDIDTPMASAVVSTNLIQNCASLPNTSGTVSYNPMFVAPGLPTAAPFPLSNSYDYRLVFTSPAIDAGAAITLPAPYNLDLAATNRFQGAAPDLGAYEWKSCTPSAMNVSIATSGPVTFCAPGSVTLTASSSSNLVAYSWNGASPASPSYTATGTGNVQLVARDTAGCRAVINTAVTAVPAPNPVITISGNTLSVPPTYASYQWYKGGVLIPGATGATYNPPTNGVYTVKVTTTAGNCPGTSTTYDLRNLGVGGASLESISVYPNPAGDVLHLSGAVNGATATLCNMAGQQVMECRLANGECSLDIHQLSTGIYMLDIRIADGERRFWRVVKQ